MLDYKIIAIDFDGTLCENKYPKIGEPNMDIIDYILRCQLNGDKVILWTCRTDKILKEAIDWCSEKGLVFDAVNENLPEIIDIFGGDTRKIFANVYIDDRNVSLYSCREKTPMDTWAENEVELACEHDRNGISDYGCACYRSALRAFNSLMEDGHSGGSIDFTKNILNRLITSKPLTPIKDIDDVWTQVGGTGTRKDIKTYQCIRMSSLFKHVSDNGDVSYNDVNRVVGIDIHSECSFHSGLLDRIVNEMAPITMPYMPSTKPYYVYCESFLHDSNNGDYDTVGVFYMIIPSGEKINISRFFARENHKFEEIDIFKYDERKEASENNKVKESE